MSLAAKPPMPPPVMIPWPLVIGLWMRGAETTIAVEDDREVTRRRWALV